MTLAGASASSPTIRAGRAQGLKNLMRMGHCAPSVMQTLLELGDAEPATGREWPIKLVAGLPGGIGNTRAECGGLTAPVVMLGLRHGSEAAPDGLPRVLEAGHGLCARFAACHGSLFCRGILGDRRVPLPCVRVVRRAPELTHASDSAGDATSLAGEQREAYRTLCRNFSERGFHCAHAVFERVQPAGPTSEDLRNASVGFMGGTLLLGQTCSALTAGVMALGLELGKIENSRSRVLRMLGRMLVGGDAFDDSINEFNRIMNLGHRLGAWFARQFGSTECRSLTESDFATQFGVAGYVERDGVRQCLAIANAVGVEVRRIVEEAQH